MNVTPIIQAILEITLPFIQQLIISKFVPKIKRKTYEILDEKADKLIEDLAQNASKLEKETDDIKRMAFYEGTKLGVDALNAIGLKLIKASQEIGKAL